MMSIELLGTVGCHLCDDAAEILNAVLGVEGYRYVDIADDESLVEAYGIRIPVVLVDHFGGSAELGWPFDRTMLENFLADQLSS